MKFNLFIMSVLISVSANAKVTGFSSDFQQMTAGEFDYSFTLSASDNANISETDLNLSHEKKIHFIVYDESLTQFRHLHPVFTGGRWTVKLPLDTNGNYRVWVQGESKADGTEFTLSQTLVVVGGANALPIPTKLGDVRSNISGATKIELSNQSLSANKMAMLDLTITQVDGTQPNLSNYLGAFAHVIAVPISGNDLIHVHPMSGNSPNKGMLHTEFPSSGDYRLWAQVLNNGEVVTVPLSVSVN